MTTIAEIFDAFQQINRQVSGIAFAPRSDEMPNQLTEDRLPAAVAWYAGDDWVKGGSTDFVIEVYVAPVGSSNPSTAMATCLKLATQFRNAYRAIPSVDGFAILTSKHTGRGGFGADGVHKTMGFGGKEYFGFSFRVPLFNVITA
jgi:hypothetical protein